jgi:hypothetical protein
MASTSTIGEGSVALATASIWVQNSVGLASTVMTCGTDWWSGTCRDAWEIFGVSLALSNPMHSVIWDAWVLCSDTGHPAPGDCFGAIFS